MKRLTASALILGLVLIVAAGAVSAHSYPLISVGVMPNGDETITFAYGEAPITPNLTGSAEYYTNGVFALGLWHGVERGLYGRVEVRDDSQLGEIGVWGEAPLSNSIAVSGWIGAQSDFGDAGVWAKASAELHALVTDSIAVFVGGDTTLLKDDPESSFWVAIGYYFR